MVTRTVRSLVTLWRTTFEVGDKEERMHFDTQLKRGLFQGDSLSPLLFCLCISPITSMLNDLNGYKCLHVEEPITHIFYMDDLKLFANTPETIEEMFTMVDEGSKAVGMSLGLRKCGVAHMEKGKRKFIGHLTLDGERQIQEVKQGGSYRYLGIAQVFAPITLTTKYRLRRKFLGRQRAVWRSLLNAKQKAISTNTWATAVFRYYFGILRWGTSELDRLDCTVRRTISRFHGHHRNASILRLYITRMEGGRGLTSLRQVWKQSVASLYEYLIRQTEPWLQGVLLHQQWKHAQFKSSLIQEVYTVFHRHGLPLPGSERESTIERPTAARMVRASQQRVLIETLRRKRIHGAHRHTLEAAEGRYDSTLWLRYGKSKAETEALVFAAQDGVLHTNKYRRDVLRQDIDPACRLCHEGMETIGHILSCCPHSLWKSIKCRHDRVLATLIKHVGRAGGLEIPSTDATSTTVEDTNTKLWVDLTIPTAKQITERRPDTPER
ncbi:uncharacterized protein [Dysidea avara]|uniref:uncharacterized protein n=1 Tax=Dysidea avara TaxID=196820 RepID=UPI003323B5CC